MTLEEAVSFIAEKLDYLYSQLNGLDEHIGEIKARTAYIKETLTILTEQNLSES